MPSFWSDQHGVRIQYLGHAHGADGVRIDGDTSARDFTATFTQRDRPVAALIVGRPHALPELRRRIHAATDPDRGSSDMTLTPHIDELACAAHGDCAVIAPDVFAVEDIAVVIGRGSDEVLTRGRTRLPRGGDRADRRRHRRAGLPLRRRPRTCPRLCLGLDRGLTRPREAGRMSMSKLIITGGTVAGLGALGAVALASNDAPTPTASPSARRVVEMPPEIRTVTVTRTIHRVRHEHAPAKTAAPTAAPAPAPAVAAARAPAAAAPAPPAAVPVRSSKPLRTSSSPGATHGESDEHEHGDDGAHGDD